MRPYSVAMVAACPFPANHGTPAAIREMCEVLSSRGHSIHVVTYPLKEDIPVQGATIHRARKIGQSQKISVGPSYQRLAFDAFMIPKLHRVIRDHNIDIIHAHNYEGALVGYAAKKSTGVPLVYNAINTMISELPSYNFIRPRFVAVMMARVLDFLVPRMADFIIADTGELESFIRERGVRPERIKVIPSGVNIEMFEGRDGQAIRERYEIGGKPLVIYTGTLDQFQGIDYLLTAFQMVHRRCPEALLLLLESTVNPLHVEKYKRMAEDLGIGACLLFTSCGIDALPDFLAAADIAVLPRPSAPGIPTKLLNYMAAGKPIVGFEGAAKGLSHMETAFLAEPGNCEGFAEGILRLIADRSLSRRLGSNAKNGIIGKFDWQSIAVRIEEIYASIIEGTRKKK